MQHKSRLTECERWLTQLIDEGQSIKVGMSRAQLLERFSEDGGFDTIPSSDMCSKVAL